MDISATEFLKHASNIAEYFGFTHVDNFKKHPACKGCKQRLRHTSSANDRKNDSIYGLLTSGILNFVDNKMHAIEAPTLFYSIEQVPRTGEVALSLQIFGVQKSIAEAVLIQTARALMEELNLKNNTVRINSLGDKDSSIRYARELTNFLKKRLDDMPPTARELMKEHVFLSLMHLIEKEHELAYKSPNPMEYLSDPSRKHFREIVEFLEMSNTPYEIDPKLIGHHQCYSDSIFVIDILDEDDKLMQNAPLIIRGGRYSNFMQQHTRTETPATGTVIILKDKKTPQRLPKANIPDNTSVYVVQLGFGPKVKSLMLINELRKAGIAVQQNLASDSLGTQLRDAEDKGVRFAVIMGQKEYVDGTVILRDMIARNQEYISIDQLVAKLRRSSAVASN